MNKTPRDKARSSERNRELRSERAAAGRCPRCNEPAIGGFKHCAVCRERASRIALRAQRNRIASGRCRRCCRGKLATKTLCRRCSVIEKARSKAKNAAVKLEVLTHYCGGQPPYCACEKCPEHKHPHVNLLTIDHIGGGGHRHRQSLMAAGTRIHLWLKKQGFPSGYRVLCFNCNIALGLFGSCPHELD